MKELARSNGPFSSEEEYYTDIEEYSKRTGIPAELIDAIQQMNYLTQQQRAGRKYDDWHPVNLGSEAGNIKENLWNIINLGEKLGIIRPGQSVLDMGSGNSSSSLIWAYRGYKVTGIEIDQKLVQLAHHFIKQYRSIIPNSAFIQVLQGSYFTKEYLNYREQQKSQARLLELKHKFRDFSPVGDDNIYLKSNLTLLGFDILYAYPWSDEEPAICEFFSLYARKDSVLCLARSELAAKELQLLRVERYPVKEEKFMPFLLKKKEM